MRYKDKLRKVVPMRDLFPICLLTLSVIGCVSREGPQNVVDSDSVNMTTVDLSTSIEGMMIRDLALEDRESASDHELIEDDSGALDQFIENQLIEDLMVFEDLNTALTDIEISAEDSMIADPSPTYFTSVRQDTRSFEFSYDRSITSGNPLKGFTTNYGWGEPNNTFPHSLEFSYIPLAEVISPSGEYQFNALETELNRATERGHHLILRFYLDYPGLESGVPMPLRDQVFCSPVDIHISMI